MSGPAAGAAIDVERRAALNGAKLAALVAGRWGPGDRQGGAIGPTATLLDPERAGAGGTAAEVVGGEPLDAGGTAAEARGAESADDGGGAAAGAEPAGGRSSRSGWALAGVETGRALGPAMVWAGRHGVGDLHLLADPGPDRAGTLARQGGLFVDGPAVWAVEGTSLAPADPAPAAVPAPAPAPPDLVDLLIDAGLEIVVEGGMVRGEINGLEVARIVHGHTTAGEPIDAPLLEVGVGKADRELTAMVHGGLPAVEQLGRVAAIVRQHRRPGAPRHPLNQLVPERWLRAVLCRDPGLIGLRSLRPAEGARARPNLAERDIAVAVGESSDGAPAVVACAVGVALDLVPTAADGRAVIDAARHDGSSPSALVIAVPRRDDHPAVRDLARRLVAPASVAPVADDWRSAG